MYIVHEEISELLLLFKTSKVFGNVGNRFLEVSTMPKFIKRDKKIEKTGRLVIGSLMIFDR